MKKILSFVLTLTLVFSMSFASVYANGTKSLQDINRNSIYTDGFEMLSWETSYTLSKGEGLSIRIKSITPDVVLESMDPEIVSVFDGKFDIIEYKDGVYEMSGAINALDVGNATVYISIPNSSYPLKRLEITVTEENLDYLNEIEEVDGAYGLEHLKVGQTEAGLFIYSKKDVDYRMEDSSIADIKLVEKTGEPDGTQYFKYLYEFKVIPKKAGRTRVIFTAPGLKSLELPVYVEGSSVSHRQIIGKDRYETSAKLADELKTYDTAVIVNGNSIADGLSAAPLAGKYNAPILLVEKNSIPASVKSRLNKANKVFIIGGEAVISKNVEKQLVGKQIKRIGGSTRIETSRLVANELGEYEEAYIVNGFTGEADAMSISPVAARYGCPILLTDGKNPSHKYDPNVDYVVIGGELAVTDKLRREYGAERISGYDRYETNRKILAKYYYEPREVYFTKGSSLVDALSASVVAKNSGIALVSQYSDNKVLNNINTVQVGGMDFEINFLE